MKPFAAPYGDESPAKTAGANELGSKSRNALLFATVLGVIGATLLMLYLSRFEEEISGGSRVPLLTVLKPIARGALVTADMLSVSEVPVAYVEKRAIKAADRSKVIGTRTANALSAQDTLMWSDLALSSEHRDLSSLVQPGRRAVSVRASEAGSDPAGNGLLRPGDYVDVIVTLGAQEMVGGRDAPASAIVLLQRVLVLAVGAETQPQAFMDSPEPRKTGSHERELTLSLKVEEVQLLSLARARGTISVALRGPDDSKVTEQVPDMPLSSLYDKAARDVVQRRRNVPTTSAPIRVTESSP